MFYSRYANRARGARALEEDPIEGAKDNVPKKRRCSPTWARLISKVDQAEPLTCRQCGGPLQIVAYIHDHFTIKAILHHLGLSLPEVERPPPHMRYVPVDDDGPELQGRVAQGMLSP